MARLLDRLKQPNVCVSADAQPYDAKLGVAAQDNGEQVQRVVKRRIRVKTPVRQSRFARRPLRWSTGSNPVQTEKPFNRKSRVGVVPLGSGWVEWTLRQVASRPDARADLVAKARRYHGRRPMQDWS